MAKAKKIKKTRPVRTSEPRKKGLDRYNHHQFDIIEPCGKTGIGFSESFLAFACYIGGWFTGILVLLSEKKSLYVRYNAIQSIITFLGLNLLLFLCVTLLGFINAFTQALFYAMSFIGAFLVATTLIAWIFLMVSANKGKIVTVPLAGKMAEKIVALQYYKAKRMEEAAEREEASEHDKADTAPASASEKD